MEQDGKGQAERAAVVMVAVLVGTVLAGPAWVWVSPVRWRGSACCSPFPIAGGAYQSSRRLLGGAYGWFSGWVAICAYAVANTTVAYLGAPWMLTLAGDAATPNRIVVAGMLIVGACAAAGAFGVGLLGRAIRVGSGRRSWRRSASASRCCSPSARSTSRSSATRSARRRCRAAPSARRCWRRSRVVGLTHLAVARSHRRLAAE